MKLLAKFDLNDFNELWKLRLYDPGPKTGYVTIQIGEEYDYGHKTYGLTPEQAVKLAGKLATWASRNGYK